MPTARRRVGGRAVTEPCGSTLPALNLPRLRAMSSAATGPLEGFDAAACIDRLAAETARAIRELGRRGAVVAVSGGVDSGVAAGDLRARASGPSTCSACGSPSATSATPRPTSRSSWPSPSAPTDRGADHRRARGARLLPAAATRRSAPSSPTTSRAGSTSSSARPHRRRSSSSRWSSSAPTAPGSSGGCRRTPTVTLLAATNMKQRVRKLLEYTWADRLGYAVIGTPNLLEYDQGFFVKGGDGLADVKPIARLYKGQVYALARELGLPEAIAVAAADDRDLQPAPDPGGVLLRPPLRAHGRADVGPRARHSSRPSCRAPGSGSAPRRSRSPTARSSGGGLRPRTCTPRRSCSRRED